MIRAFFHGFAYAGKGVLGAIAQERNFRFHLCITVYVYVFSLFYKFTAMEYIALTLIVVGVLALELVNSAIERAVDIACPQQARNAGMAKDLAAGAVLVFCIGAAVCGVFLFWDVAVFGQMFRFFVASPIWLLILACSLAASCWFVFSFRISPKKGDKSGSK